jgi:predicted RNA binding protein YcfA (HicA-like mRNA interferase family)
VAKNAKTAGAGKHKDIRKMLKDIRGQKHKAKMEEEVEQLDEISKGTLANYTSSAAVDLAKRSLSVGQKSGKGAWSDDPEHRKYDITKDKDKDKMVKRVSGITKASMRLAKEEVELLDEMPESSMKTRDVHAHLKSKGWAIARTSGGHDIYKHPKAKNVIAVPRHKQLKAPLIKGILKSSHVSEEVMDEQLVKQGRFQSGPVKKPFKSITSVSSMKEAVKLGGTGGRGNIYNYDRNPEPKDGNELENVPFHPKTEQQKKLKAALTDLGKKMKETHPKLKEALGDPITIVKKGTNIKQKISPNSYETFKHHGFRKEETVQEGRASQRHPLEGHEYHKKSNEALVHIAKDAHKAAEAMKGHNTDAENKYRDQANDSATVRHFRQKSGMPDWYKKKYGHVNEEVEQIDELSSKTLHSYVHKATPQSHLRTKGINKALTKSMYKAMAPKPKSVKEESEVIDEDQNDYRRKIEKNNKRFVAATKRQQNPLTNVPIAKEIEKRMQQKPVKEDSDPCWKGYKMVGTKQKNGRTVPNCVPGKGVPAMKKESAQEPTEGEMKGKQQGMSRRAQIVKDAAKGKKSEGPDKFQKDPELSSEIHKT